MGLLYFILALVIFLILAPVGIIFCIVRNFKGADRKFTQVAESIDRLGNVICADIFNYCLLKDSKHLFGDGRETISSVIGRNVLAETLSPFGKRINGLLDRVKKNHSVENIGY